MQNLTQSFAPNENVRIIGKREKIPATVLYNRNEHTACVRLPNGDTDEVPTYLIERVETRN